MEDLPEQEIQNHRSASGIGTDTDACELAEDTEGEGEMQAPSRDSFGWIGRDSSSFGNLDRASLLRDFEK